MCFLSHNRIVKKKIAVWHYYKVRDIDQKQNGERAGGEVGLGKKSYDLVEVLSDFRIF